MTTMYVHPTVINGITLDGEYAPNVGRVRGADLARRTTIALELGRRVDINRNLTDEQLRAAAILRLKHVGLLNIPCEDLLEVAALCMAEVERIARTEASQ